MKKRFLWSAIIILGISLTVFAQNNGNQTSADRTLRGSGRVNASTLAMEFDLPLGAYPGRGINLPVGLSYSSKLWRLDYMGNHPVANTNYSPCNPRYNPIFAENSASGWTTSLAVPYIEYVGAKNYYEYDGTPYAFDDVTCPTFNPDPNHQKYWIRRIVIHLPSGETHEMRPDDSEIPAVTGQAEDWNTTYFAVDGSNLKYIQNSASGIYRLLMPDGSFYDFDNTNPGAADRKALKFTDRNGNYTTYYGPGSIDNNGITHPNGYWKDTLGRNVSIPIGLRAPTAPTTVSNPQTYSMPGLFGTSTVDYKLHWKRLKGSSPAESGLTNFSDNLKYLGDRYYCQTTICSHPAGTYLFAGGEIVVAGEPMILTSDIFNPLVLTEIELPTGQNYKFSYDVYGRINQINYPTGGEEVFTYSVVPTLSVLEPNSIGGQTNFGVTERKVYPTPGGSFYKWTYSADYVAPKGYKVTINNPDDTKVERFLHRGNDFVYGQPTGIFGFDNILAGMQYEQRVYDGMNKQVSRSLTHWTKTYYGQSHTNADWHPRVTHEESYVYDPDGNGNYVRATMKYEYEDLSSRDKPLLRKKTSQYEYQASSGSSNTIPPGGSPDPNPTPVPTPVPPNLIRISETTYLIYDTFITNRQDYIDRNMVGQVTASVVKDPAGTIVSRSEMKYDDAGYSPSDYVRGNPTTARVWDSGKGNYDNTNAYVTTRARFDTYGNQYEAIDAKGNSTTTVFDSTYRTFPIQVTSAVPDPSGTHGSDTSFITTVTFDPVTGLPLTTIDANGLESRIEYDAATLRPIRTKTFYNNQQVGSEAETIYHDQPGNYWVKNRAQIDTNKWAESITYFDGLGRAYKAEQVNSEGNIFVEKEFDAEGRIKRVTNPFRANETKQWTTNVYDDASRIKEVILPDGAKVITDYSVSVSGIIGVTKQITDQAQKRRKSIGDALGRLVEVVEDPNINGTSDKLDYSTTYSYDVLGNLKQVNQGQQVRTFVHDSLSRLKQATNPESGLIQYGYDNNGNLTQKTDARNVVTAYSYDALNRIVQRSYTAPLNLPNYGASPTVTYTYDNLPNANGKLIRVDNGFSKTEYQAFDIFGRITQSQQFVEGTSYGEAMTYSYNLSGAIIEQKYPSGRMVKNVLDNNGDMAIVQSKKNLNAGYFNYAKNITYTASGAVSSTQLGNGIWESTQFNSRLQPIQIALGTVQNGTDKLKLNFNYNTSGQNDNNGNVLSQTITVPNVGTTTGFTAVQTYTYDALNRLKSATENIDGNLTPEWKQTFTYDRYGNRNFDTTTNNTTTIPSGCAVAVCNPQVDSTTNKLVGYQYDLSGNTKVDAENRTFIYDGENKQVEVKDVNNVFIGKYFYDGDGKRVKKISATETTIFVYNAGGQLVEEYSTQISQTPQVSYLTSDHLGSPRINTDANGSVTARHDYQPFGEEIQRPGYGADNIREKFATYERDEETNLDFAQARYFNSNFGRFSSPDNFLNDTDITDPRSLNLYSYVRNNPLRFIDPTGERIWIYYQETITRIDEDGNEIIEAVTRRVEFTFGGLLNEDGSEYTGNNEYVMTVARNLTFLLQDEVLAGAIRDMVRTRENFNIMRDPNDPNNNLTDPERTQKAGKGTTIYWSAGEATYWNDMDETKPSGRVPAFAALAHELIGHAWMRFKGIERQGDVAIAGEPLHGRPTNGPVREWEIDAVNIENRAMMIENPCVDPRCSTLRTKIAGRDVSPYLDFEGFLEPRRKSNRPNKIKLNW